MVDDSSKYLFLQFTICWAQLTNWTEIVNLPMPVEVSVCTEKIYVSVQTSSFGFGTFHSVTAFVSFGVNTLNSTRGNMQCITSSVCSVAKENIQWEVSPCGSEERIFV